MNPRNYRRPQTTNNFRQLFDLVGLGVLVYNAYLNSQQVQIGKENNVLQHSVSEGLKEVNRELDILNHNLKERNHNENN